MVGKHLFLNVSRRSLCDSCVADVCIKHQGGRVFECDAKWPTLQTKSSMMLGLGETDEQILQTLKDLRRVHCDRLSLGQYLKPDKNSLEVVDFVHPDKFDQWAATAPFAGV